MPEITVLQVIQHSPTWVFVLFAALVALGLLNTRTREMHKFQLTLLPLAFIGLSAWGIWSAFGMEPAAIASWAMALAAVAAIGWSFEPLQGASIVAGTSKVLVPGSWWPLVLILATFVTRYAVTVMLIRNPSLRHAVPMELFAGLAYGVLSGVFVARAVSVLRTVAATSTDPQAVLVPAP